MTTLDTNSGAVRIPLTLLTLLTLVTLAILVYLPTLVTLPPVLVQLTLIAFLGNTEISSNNIVNIVDAMYQRAEMSPPIRVVLAAQVRDEFNLFMERRHKLSHAVISFCLAETTTHNHTQSRTHKHTRQMTFVEGDPYTLASNCAECTSPVSLSSSKNTLTYRELELSSHQHNIAPHYSINTAPISTHNPEHHRAK
jgi:hypothetical protein